MDGPISLIEIGLALILLSRSFTRIYQRRAVALLGVAGVRIAEIAGSGVVPVWVSLLSVTGWAMALPAAAWAIFG